MTFQQMLLILRLRWWLVLSLFLLVVAAAWGISVKLPKQYTAQTSILLDAKVDPLLATLVPAMISPAFIATETEIIRSDRVASRVVQMLGLAQSSAAVEQWREATEGRVSLESYYGSLLQKGLLVEPARGSNLLMLEFTGTDPKFAAAAANAFARSYIDLNVELRVEPARQYNTFFDDRLKGLRSELEAAQTKLSAFQQKKGIVATEDRVDLETGRLNAIMGQLATAQAEQADTQSRARNTGSETSPDVQSSPIVQGLKADLARLQAKHSELSSRYGSAHPERQQLEAQISELRRQIGAEMARVSGATTTVNRVTGQKITELRNMAEQQKQYVLSLRAERDEMSVLQKDVQTAQRAYEAVAQRRSQLSLESQANQGSARVLSGAVEPIKHSKPNIPKNMVAAVIVGLILGLAAAVGWEMLDRRVRSATDLRVAEGVPVLGVLSGKGRASGPFAHQRWPALAPPRASTAPRLTMGGTGG